MKIFPILCLLLCGSLGLASEQKKVPLPEQIDFKKALTLTSVLLFDTPQEDPKIVADLAAKLSHYAVLETEAKGVIKPLQVNRKVYKDTVRKTTFKNEEDLNKVIEQLQKETDVITANGIKDLERDRLIRFDEKAEPVSGSSQYTLILEKAKEYHKQLIELQKHPLFADLEKARRELKPAMQSFLHGKYKTVEDLREDFHAPIKKVDAYLNAL